jgi:hypothetical protein
MWKIPEEYLATGYLLFYSLQFNLQGGQNVLSPPTEMFTWRYKLLPVQQQN